MDAVELASEIIFQEISMYCEPSDESEEDESHSESDAESTPHEERRQSSTTQQDCQAEVRPTRPAGIFRRIARKFRG